MQHHPLVVHRTLHVRAIIIDLPPDFPGQVVAKAPDKAQVSTDQINVFLYHMPLSAAWRNMDVPRQVRRQVDPAGHEHPGDTGAEPEHVERPAEQAQGHENHEHDDEPDRRGRADLRRRTARAPSGAP